MSSPILGSSTGAIASGSTVRTRRVFHITGYDGRPGDASYGLFRREFIRRRERTRSDATLSEPKADGSDLSWSARFSEGDEPVDVDYTLLRWDDLVRQDRERPFWKRGASALMTLGMTFWSGAFVRLAKANPWFAAVWIGPFAACVAAPAIGLTAGAIVYFALGVNVSASLAIAALISATLLWVAVTLRAETLFDLTAIPGPASLGRIGQLFDLWSFARAYANRDCPGLEERLDAFAQRIEAAVRERTHDEILVIGHSMGAVLAVDVLARVRERIDDEAIRVGPNLSLLTIGALHELPASYPTGGWFKKKIETVAGHGSLHWVEYVDPSDPFNFPFGDFMDRLGLSRNHQGGNPHILTADFRNALSEATLRRARVRLFRMHFQFVMTSETPGGYDFFDFLSSSWPQKKRLAQENLKGAV